MTPTPAAADRHGRRTAAILPAAGRGERFGAALPKALVTIDGVPMVTLAVQALAQAASVDVVVVAAPLSHLDAVIGLLAEDLELGGTELIIVVGGETRQDSVRLALEAIADDADVDVVLVHDAARPLMPVPVIDAVTAAVRAGAPAVVPGIAVVDTVKRVDASGVVQETLDRAALRAIQTPQGFRRDVLERAHAGGASSATDDAGLVEAMGVPVMVVPGSDDGFKVTRPSDLAIAEAVLQRREIHAMVDREMASWPSMQALAGRRPDPGSGPSTQTAAGPGSTAPESAAPGSSAPASAGPGSSGD